MPMEKDGIVHVPRMEYLALLADAGAWRLLMKSPHVAELLEQFIEWDRRKTEHETSEAIRTGLNRERWIVPTYAELERRRYGNDAPRYMAERRAHQGHLRSVSGCPLCT